MPIFRVLFCAATVLILVSGLSSASKDDKSTELKITNMEKLNTPGDEDDPCPTPDGTSFYFTLAKNSGAKTDLMSATRKLKSQPFANPRIIEELAGKTDDASPFAMAREPDGSEYLYFASMRDAKNFDIFFTRRLKPDQPFQRIAIAAVHQICTEADERDPCVTADEKGIYFSRKTKDGWRVGYAYGPDRRAFDKVELLDLPVGFCHPSVSRDGLTLYLHGPVEQGKEKLGLFVSKRGSRAGKWSKPEPIEAINCKDSERGERSPRLSADGAFLSFASDRPGGKGGLDLYFVSLADLKKASS
jgi:WD40 repeat protein